MSVQAMSWVFDYSESTSGFRLVLLSIANHCDRFGTDAWPKLETLAEESRLCIREVSYAINALVELGELTVEKGKGKVGRNRYTLTKFAPAKFAGRPPELPANSNIPTCSPLQVPPANSNIAIRKNHPTSLNQPSKPIEFPEWIPREQFEHFVQMRKLIKKPLTEHATSLAINELGKLRAQGQDIIAVIEKSILHNWLGFFPSPPPMASVKGFIPRDFKQESLEHSQNEYMTKNHGPNWRQKVAANAQS